MTIRITKDKALSDVAKYFNQIKNSKVENFSKEQVLKLIDDVKDEIEHIDMSRFSSVQPVESETIDKLKRQNKELTIDRWNLVSKIKSLENENRAFNQRGFILSKEQQEEVDRWWEQHKNKKHPDGYFGVNGGPLTYSFNPTSMGEIITVKCSCGEELNLTNFDEF